MSALSSGQDEHAVIDPNDPTSIVQTGSQRTNGFEIGLNGNVTRAEVTGGYAYQDAFITERRRPP